jgi:hypothetical protein
VNHLNSIFSHLFLSLPSIAFQRDLLTEVLYAFLVSHNWTTDCHEISSSANALYYIFNALRFLFWMTVRLVIRFVRVLLFHVVAEAYCTTLLCAEWSRCNRFGQSSSSNSRNDNVGSILHSPLPTYYAYSETPMAPVIPLFSSVCRDRDNSIFRNSDWHYVTVYWIVTYLAHQLRVRLPSTSSAFPADWLPTEVNNFL